MIKHLRRRFIRIAVISAAAVLLLLSLTVNIANYISVNSGLCDMLTAISCLLYTSTCCKTDSHRAEQRAYCSCVSRGGAESHKAERARNGNSRTYISVDEHYNELNRYGQYCKRYCKALCGF